MRSKYRELIIGAIALLVVAIVASVAVAQPTTYAGVTFPLGDLSFAAVSIGHTRMPVPPLVPPIVAATHAKTAPGAIHVPLPLGSA